MVLSLRAFEDATSAARTAFVPDKPENLTDSDYESDLELETTDFYTGRGIIDDMQNSDMEDVSHLLFRGH